MPEQLFNDRKFRVPFPVVYAKNTDFGKRMKRAEASQGLVSDSGLSSSISAWASHPDSDIDQVVHKKKNRLCKTGCYWLSLYIDGAWREIPVDRTLPKGLDLLQCTFLRKKKTL